MVCDFTLLFREAGPVGGQSLEGGRRASHEEAGRTSFCVFASLLVFLRERGSNSTLCKLVGTIGCRLGGCERKGGGRRKKGVGSLAESQTSHPQKREKVEHVGTLAGGREEGGDARF